MNRDDLLTALTTERYGEAHVLRREAEVVRHNVQAEEQERQEAAARRRTLKDW